MHFVTNCSKVAALACVLSAVACGGEDSQRPVITTVSALENPIAACEAEMSTCQRGPGPGGGCQEQMRSCLESYAEWLRAVREGIAQCRTEAGLCVANGGRENCREGYDRCLNALWTNNPSDDDGGVADEDGGAAGQTAAGAGGRTAGRGPRGGAGGAGGRAAPGGRAGAGGRGGFGFPGLGSSAGFPGRGGAGTSAGAAANGGGPGLPGFPQPAGRGAPGLPTPPSGLPGQGQAGPGFGAGQPTPEAECMAQLAQCMTSGRDLAECAGDARQCLRTDPISALFRP
jgi:hypothetical protein